MFDLMTAAALAAATALSPGLVGAAAATDVSAPTAAAEATDSSSRWGINDDGWNVTIHNEMESLKPEYGIFSNIKHVDPVIAAFATNRNTRGVGSVFGGPANMDLTLRKADPAIPVATDVALLTISSDWASSAPRVLCIELRTDVSCAVSAPSVAAPVQITLLQRF